MFGYFQPYLCSESCTETCHFDRMGHIWQGLDASMKPHLPQSSCAVTLLVWLHGEDAWLLMAQVIFKLLISAFSTSTNQNMWPTPIKPAVSRQNTVWDTGQKNMSQNNRKQRNFQEKYLVFMGETLSEYDKSYIILELRISAFSASTNLKHYFIIKLRLVALEWGTLYYTDV